MESQISLNTLYVLPALGTLLMSVLLFLLLKKPLSTIVGKISPREIVLQGITIFCQLLLMSIFIDHLTIALGVNDTQVVEQTINTLRTLNVETVGSIIGNAAIEELFFRGIVYTWLGGLVSTILFGVFHAGYYSWVQFIASLAAGYILLRAREQNQSILPGIAGHALYNLAIVFMLS